MVAGNHTSETSDVPQPTTGADVAGQIILVRRGKDLSAFYQQGNTNATSKWISISYVTHIFLHSSWPCLFMSGIHVIIIVINHDLSQHHQYDQPYHLIFFSHSSLLHKVPDSDYPVAI